MTLISHFNRKSLFIGIGKSIGAGILSHGVFVSLSSVYKIHKRFTSSSAIIASKHITPILSLEVLKKKITQLSLNKALYDKVLVKRKELYEKHDSVLKKGNLPKDSVVLKNLLNSGWKALNELLVYHPDPGKDSENHPLKKIIPIVFHDSFLEQDPLIVLSVLESSIRQAMSEENVFIKEYVKKLTLEHENLTFKTKISQEIEVKDLTKADLIVECLNRNLLKEDKKNHIYVKDSLDQNVIIGDSLYDYKFTPLFMALYKNLYDKDKKDLQELSLEKIPPENDLKFDLISLPVKYIHTNAFMPTGAQNHINTAIYIDNLKQKLLTFGFLTTQKSGLDLADYQFDIFQQKNKIGDTYKFPPNLLPQRFMSFNNMREFSVESIKILKNSTEYIQEVADIEVLYSAITAIRKNPIFKGNDYAISLDEVLEVCKKFDYNKHNNIPQPKTDLQIKKDNENIEAMKIKAKLLKKCKEQQLNINNNED